uniref:protein-serine/threonine phosphatase n=1 Tax=Setaria italica TaxID=4555 RepID=K3XVG7_SETIT
MENDPQHTSVMPRDFTFHLLEQITNKFSKDRIIGYGGYGVVYKGVLDNGEEVAVKKLYNKHPGLDDDKQFTNECTNLMRLQHQNIVRLVGYCYEIAHKVVEYDGQYVYAGVEERALCFEYLQGGTLEKLLSDESCGLGWHKRYKIIRGVCEGLHYLHNGSKDPIYHLDLKPANIMLDKNMVPKIGDFGLSRLFDSTQTCTTKVIIGTPGYMPPEYINRYQITQKFDVFSLGVIIIQVMAGRGGYLKCGDMSHQEFIDLVQGNWGKRLQVTMSSHTSHEIKTCIEIALRCVESDRVKRPTIAEIVDELNKIDDVKRSLADEDNLHSTQVKLYTNSGAADAEGALTVDHRDDGKEQEHMTLEDKILEDDPSDTEYPGPQTGGTLERLPTLKAKSGGRKAQDDLLWCHDLARCQDGDFSVAAMQANHFMEDQCLVESGLPFGTFAGIFDGHGGPEAAYFIRDHLLPNLQADAIREAFLATEQGFITLVSRQWETKPSLATVGSCCLVGVVHQRTLFIANLGDSRAVLGKVWHVTEEVLAVPLSAEHNVNYDKARKELIAEHPDDPDIVVFKHNVWRVKGIFQLSRSIGDAFLKDPRYNMEPLTTKFRLRTPFSKPLLSASPSILSHSLQPCDRFVIFASDGLWEHLTNQEAVDIVQKHQRAEGSARRLIKAALLEASRKREMTYSHLKTIGKGVRRHFHDDITVIVLFFSHAVQPLSIRCPLDNGSNGPLSSSSMDAQFLAPGNADEMLS